jgi:hypothetical protein
LHFYELSLMIYLSMKEETIIHALQSKFKEDMETPENVHYNEGIIDAIEEVKKQYRLQKLQQTQ